MVYKCTGTCNLPINNSQKYFWKAVTLTGSNQKSFVMICFVLFFSAHSALDICIIAKHYESDFGFLIKNLYR